MPDDPAPVNPDGERLREELRREREARKSSRGTGKGGEVAGGIFVIVVFCALLIGGGVLIASWLGGDSEPERRSPRADAPRVLTATPGPTVRFRTFYVMDPLPGVPYSDIEDMALSACEAFDDGVSAADLILVILDRMAPEYHERTAALLGAGVAAFCPEYSRRFREIAQ